MDTISDYFSKDDEISRLNKQLSMVAKFYDDFYKGEVEKYKIRASRVQRENKRMRERVDKYKAVQKKTQHKGMIRAKELIRSKVYGGHLIKNVDIAEICFIGLSSVGRLISEVNNEKRTNIINHQERSL